MPDRELLQNYGLYRRKNIDLPYRRSDWPKPAINARCSHCKTDQTFNMLNDYEQYDEVVGRAVATSQGIQFSSTLRMVYSCAACSKARRYYLVFVSQARPHANALRPPATEGPAAVIKVGQYPAADISADPQLAAKLGPWLPTYSKGAVCESQGYGIGAFAYYRRIVEEMIGGLLDDILPLIPEGDREAYAEALERAKASHNAADKIEIVKHLLPATLRPGGANPLSLLHGTLSEGIHALGDEECLERAVSTREVLVYLVHQIAETRRSAQRFNDHLKKLLDDRASRGSE